MIGLGISIATVSEFNRRALIALKGVSYAMETAAPDIVASIRIRVNAGQELSPKQQQALYNIVHRYRRQITDKMVLDYAETRARGAD